MREFKKASKEEDAPVPVPPVPMPTAPREELKKPDPTGTHGTN
jgi:hypothetical protein